MKLVNMILGGERRSKFLTTVLLAAMLFAPTLSFGAENKPTFPPYPDKWLWLPGKAVVGPGRTTLHPMPDGDVLVSYSARNSRQDYQAQAFFSGTRHESVESVFGGKYPSTPPRYRVNLSDGTVATWIGGAACSGELGAKVIIEDKDAKPLRSTSLLLRMDKPFERVSVTCEERDHPAWSSPIVIVSPWSPLALEDGTFLIIDAQTGVVVRLGADLLVRGKLSRDRIVAVDADALYRKAYEFANPNGHGIDWPRYFDYLLHTYFD